jgi:hypothetical protein
MQVYIFCFVDFALDDESLQIFLTDFASDAEYFQILLRISKSHINAINNLYTSINWPWFKKNIYLTEIPLILE